MLAGGISSRWMMANVIALLVAGVLGLATPLVSSGLGVTAADATSGAKLLYLAVEMSLTPISMAAYAYLTGQVLSLIAPKFSMRRWLTLHIGIGVITGLASGLPEITPEDGSTSDNTEYLHIMLIVGPIVGALVGLVFGWLQTLILKRFATGMRSWIVISAISTSIVVLVAVSFTFLWGSPNEKSLTAKLIDEGAYVIGGIISAAIMLLALSRLQPKADTYLSS